MAHATRAPSASAPASGAPTDAQSNDTDTSTERDIPTARGRDAAIDAANAAYREGDWRATCDLLAPYLDWMNAGVNDLATREVALIYLDASYHRIEVGEASYELQPADEQLLRNIVQTSTGDLPPAVYGPTLYQAYAATKRAIKDEAANRCEFERAACAADSESLQVEYARLRQDHENLRSDFEAQDVEVRDFGVRTRALALLPFGLGHFYNNKPKLGITFLVSEAAFGATALGLLLTRVVKYDCARTAGFKPSSLDCDVQYSEQTRREIVTVRQSEEVFGWLFLGTVVTDIVLSQILFEPYGEIRRRKVPRRDLDTPVDSDDDTSRAVLRLRPGSGVVRRGLTLGLTLDF